VTARELWFSSWDAPVDVEATTAHQRLGPALLRQALTLLCFQRDFSVEAVLQGAWAPQYAKQERQSFGRRIAFALDYLVRLRHRRSEALRTWREWLSQCAQSRLGVSCDADQCQLPLRPFFCQVDGRR
jgi:hypothetical protein